MKQDIQREIEQKIAQEQRFNSPSRGQITFKEMVYLVGLFMHANPTATYQLVVGTDSHIYNNQVDFVSAVIVHRIGEGGIYFWEPHREHRKSYVLRDRMYQEALYSIDLAKEFMDQFTLEGIIHFNIEIHVDIGENGKSRDMIKEVVGMVRGNGFVVKIKPNAYAASSVADRHT